MYKQSPAREIRIASLTCMLLLAAHALSAVEDDSLGLLTPEEFAAQVNNHATEPYDLHDHEERPIRIKKMIVEGNRSIPTYTILSKSPYRVGDLITRSKNRLLLRGLYKTFGIIGKIEIEEESPGIATMYLIVTEKRTIRKVSLRGNSVIGTRTLSEKLDLASVTTADEGDFTVWGEKIRKQYAEKSYHNVNVVGSFITNDEGEVEVVLAIDEGRPTYVQHVNFTGNHIATDRQLKALLFTREDWILGFLNRAGTFQPEALEYDKSVIENFYQNRGYLAARVTNAEVMPIPGTCNVSVTFHIHEGDLYIISEVHAEENQLLSEAEQLAIIPIKRGQIYIKELIRDTLETLRMIWGEHGHIYADVHPTVVPDPEHKTVAITFHSELGSSMKLNRITLIGNSKTNDSVIRRQVTLQENELITTRQLELSKSRVQSLGYFEPKNGVNWNIVRLDDETADLELLLQEVKTGQYFFQLGTGGMPTDKSSPSDTFRVSIGLQNSNWWGRGIQGNVSASYSRQDRSFDVTLADPWLFDRPLYGSLHVFHRRSTYEDFKLANNDHPSELTTAGFAKLGFAIPQLLNVTALAEGGFESICFQEIAQDNTLDPLFKRRFQSGNVLSLGFTLMQDLRNHPTHPTAGYLWNTSVKTGIPYSLSKTDFGFVKWDLDAQWYASLIDEYDLIFRLHVFASVIHQIKNYSVPYRELFHIGGPATVRGFLFGQIGPSVHGNSLGSLKAFVINAELLFPIKLDASIRGVLFYDGGAGWDTPDRQLIPDGLLMNNHFNFRHAVGFGVRLTQPTPVRIDVGFKLDRKKRLNEPLSEVHFTMARDF